MLATHSGIVHLPLNLQAYSAQRGAQFMDGFRVGEWTTSSSWLISNSAQLEELVTEVLQML
jgi:hypothetical protein